MSSTDKYKGVPPELVDGESGPSATTTLEEGKVIIASKDGKLPTGVDMAKFERTIIMDDEVNARLSEPSQKTSPTKTKKLSIRRPKKDERTRTLLQTLEDTFSAIGGRLSGDDDKTTFITQTQDFGKTDTDVVASHDTSGEGLAEVGSFYELKDMIAEGGQGVISRAVDVRFHRVVAVKSLRDNLIDNNTVRASFIDEAEITAQLEHPAIVPVYGLHSDSKRGLHLAMKLVQGWTLREHIKALRESYERLSRGRVEIRERHLLRQRLELFLKICDAMSYAHHKGVVHRDLKPDNIMIGRFNETYIMDWGIATKFDAENPKPAGQVSGSPRYISPDILNKWPLDQRSDIYLLGIILFEIVYLKRAFPQPSVDEALKAARQGILSSFKHHFHCAVDADLTAIVKKALMFQPVERYETVEMMASDIRNYLNDEAVSVSPHPVWSSFFRWMRRHSKGLLWSVTLLMVIVVAGIGSTVTKQWQNLLLFKNAEQTVTELAMGSVYAGGRFDSEFGKLDESLLSIGKELAYCLDNPSRQEDLGGFYPYENRDKNTTVPPHFELSEVMDMVVSYDAMVYKAAPGAKPADLERLLSSLAPMMSMSRRIVQTREGVPGRRRSTGAVSLYLGLSNGLFVCYPYNLDLPQDYDPRLHDWYADALTLEEGKTRWSSPYPTESKTRQMVITGSVPVFSKDGRVLGVVGMDVSMERLFDTLVRNGNNGTYIGEKYLVNSIGKIYADSSKRRSPMISGNQVYFRDFPDISAFKEMSVFKKGHVISKKNPNKIYVFMYLPSLDWLFIETVDRQKMIDSLN